MAHQSGIPKIMLYRQLGKKAINRVNVYVKPILTQGPSKTTIYNETMVTAGIKI